MYILHLSDLHTEDRLTNVWQGIRAALERDGEDKVDVIVISGDLTTRASEADIQDLDTFLTTVSSYVDGDRSRIVLVPGNHDVDRSAEVTQPLDLTRQDVGAFARRFANYRKAPGKSSLRLAMASNGHLQWRERLEGQSYRKRFARIGAYLEDFYGDVLERRGGRCFRLGEDDKHHWSAHVFPEFEAAIFGFNSCQHVDTYWEGPSISQSAIAAAKDLAARLRPKSTVRAAVWHHGFTATQHRSDRLDLATLANLSNAGFRVGFHGHTHQEESHATSRLIDNMLVMSTGSIGARGAHLREGVSGQFSVVTLRPTSVRAELYERTTEQYASGGGRVLQIPIGAQAEAEPTAGVRARLHRRTWEVAEDGVATVTIDLVDLRGKGKYHIGLLRPPFGGLEVISGAKEDREGQSTRIIWDNLKTRSPRHQATFKISNAIALTKAELSELELRAPYFTNLPDNMDIICHTVGFDCDELELRLEFPRGDGPARIMPFVQSQRINAGGPSWQREIEEEQRLRSSCSLTDNTASLTVRGPRLNFQYGLAFEPRRDGVVLPTLARNIARELLMDCLGGQDRVKQALTRSVRKHVLACIDDDALAPEARLEIEEGNTRLLSDDSVWVGYLWNHESRHQHAAFGDFLPRQWNDRFPSGRGIVGHSFRFDGSVSWRRGDPNVLYYRTPLPLSEDHEPRYILAVPLRAYDDQLPAARAVTLGTVGFGLRPAPRNQVTFENMLIYAIEDHLDHKDASPSMSHSTLRLVNFLDNLEWAVNIGFWRAVVDEDLLSFPLRSFAKQTLNRALAKSKPDP